MPAIRTVIDVGGQDCKAIRVDENGGLADFAMNDKCAAGTGRSLELNAEALGVDVSELGDLSLRAEEEIEIASQCSIFTEMEIMHLLMEERSAADIAAGINKAMARRVRTLAGKVGADIVAGIARSVASKVALLARRVEFREKVVMVGGVALNRGVIGYVEEELQLKLSP